LTFDDI
jgi:hypothetical protein